jgi:hypothetical protein
MKRIYSKILQFLALMLAIVKKGYAKKSQAKQPLTNAKKTYIKIFALLNISILLMAIAILILTLGTPATSPVSIIKPAPGNTTEPTSPNNTSPNQPSSPGTGSNVHVEPSPSNGSNQQPSTIVKVGAYDGDPSGSQFKAMSPINWSADGSILPGQNRSSSRVYLRNEGNVPVTLQLSNQSWSFKDYLGNDLNQSYQKYFSVTWDYDNSTLPVNQVKSVVFTLTISPVIADVMTFSFDLVIIVNS